MLKRRQFFTFFAVLLMMIGGLFALSMFESAIRAQSQTQTQTQPTSQPISHFRLLIEDLRTRSIPFSVEFAASLPTGERSRTFNAEPIQVGDDYFCFGEPWNNQTRYHCTPFDNIVSVTFTE